MNHLFSFFFFTDADLIVWETCSREDGYFLASGNAVHSINGRYSGLNHLLWVDATLRVDRLTCNMKNNSIDRNELYGIFFSAASD